MNITKIGLLSGLFLIAAAAAVQAERDDSSLNISNNYRLLIIDEMGRKLGCSAKEFFKEIPKGSSGVDAIDDDVTGERDNDPRQDTQIDNPPKGVYLLSAYFSETGKFELRITGFSTNGGQKKTIEFTQEGKKKQTLPF